jgi:anti-sigma-K factor RskA
VITHDQAHDLLAAFALDAVDGGIEHDQIESHLNECPRCATEIVALRDVASALGNCVEPVPERLWSVISSRLSVSKQEEPAPPLLKVLPSRTGKKASRVSAETPRSRTGRRYLIVVTSVAAAAAAVAAVLGFSLVRTSDQNDRLQAQIGSNSSSVVAALETPGHTLVSLRAPNHAKLAQFVLLPSGRGYLVSSALPKLTPDHTYQLWGIIEGQAISLGLLGPAPSQAAFTVAGSSGVPSQLGVTAEPAGGSVLPTTTMLASSRI